MHDIQLRHIRASRRGKVDFDTILQASQSPSRPRNRQPLAVRRHVMPVGIALLLLSVWLCGLGPLRPALGTALGMVEPTPNDSLQTLPLRTVVFNATGDIDALISLVSAFFRAEDPSLELRFKQFVQQQAMRWGHKGPAKATTRQPHTGVTSTWSGASTGSTACSVCCCQFGCCQCCGHGASQCSSQ